MTKDKIVYVSLLYQQDQLMKFLGVFSTEEKAIERCLKEPTRTRREWSADSQNTWHNGAGLVTKVLPQNLC
jgi:hypothetical protein